MDKYDVLKEIGQGTFGSVLKGVHKATGELVAVKKMKQKYYSWEECVKLPEVAALRKFNSHPNIVKLKEVVRENNILYFVFEFLDGDMLGRMKQFKNQNGVGLPHHLVKSYTHQLLQSLQFLHRCGWFHRDLKPENILLKHGDGGRPDIIKLADFGLVKEIRARPPFTDYVSTRWYRSPEILLQDRAYSSPCDMWAVGCMISEFYTTRPLFPGSNEVDQMFRIITILGTPSEASWPEGYAMAKKIQYKFPLVAPTALEKVLGPHVPAEAIDLVKQLLVFDPRKRLTAMQALNHPFFQGSIEEDSRIIPSHMKSQQQQLQQHVAGTMHGGGGGVTQLSKAPSAPSPHYSKQVEWKQESAIKEIANPLKNAKPSSAEGLANRMPPVAIPQASNPPPNNNNNTGISKAVAGGGKVSVGQYQNNASNRAKPLMGGTSGINHKPSTLTKKLSPQNSPRGGGVTNKPFDFAAWQRVKEGSGAAGAGAVVKPIATGVGGGSPPLIRSGGGGSASRERPPLSGGTPHNNHSSSSYNNTAGLNLPSSSSPTPGTVGAAVVGKRSSPHQHQANKDIVDQALEELLGNTSPSWTSKHGSSGNISAGGSAGGAAGGIGRQNSFGSSGGGGGGGGGIPRRGSGIESPLQELMRSSNYNNTSTKSVNENPQGGSGGVVDTTTTGSGLRDRSNVARRGSGGVVIGSSQPLAPISPSVSSILERRKNAGGNFHTQPSGNYGGTKLHF